MALLKPLRLVKILGACLVIIALIVMPSGASVKRAAAASTDIFLKIDGIDGESTASGHKGEFEISSYSFGASNAGSSAMGGGMGTGKVKMNDFHIIAKSGKASPMLFQAVASGKHFPKATITAVSGGNTITWDLQDVLITSYQATASNTETPTDEFSFNFTKIQTEYKSGSGSSDVIKAGWDVKANVKI